MTIDSDASDLNPDAAVREFSGTSLVWTLSDFAGSPSSEIYDFETDGPQPFQGGRLIYRSSVDVASFTWPFAGPVPVIWGEGIGINLEAYRAGLGTAPTDVSFLKDIEGNFFVATLSNVFVR